MFEILGVDMAADPSDSLQTQKLKVENAEQQKASPRQQNRRTPASRPILRRQIELGTFYAQTVMRRSYERLPSYLFSLEVIIRAKAEDKNQNAVEEFHSQLDELIDNLHKELEAAIGRSRHLMEENGIEDLVENSAPQTFNVEISSPQMSRMLSALQLLDELLTIFATLWLNSLMKSKDYWPQSKQYRNRVMNVASRIIGLENRARASARTQGLEINTPPLADNDLHTINEAELLREEIETSHVQEDTEELVAV